MIRRRVSSRITHGGLNHAQKIRDKIKDVRRSEHIIALALIDYLKALANEDTVLRAHCCRHKCFPVCPRSQHLLRTQILCPGHKKDISDFVQKHFASATNVSQFA